MKIFTYLFSKNIMFTENRESLVKIQNIATFTVWFLLLIAYAHLKLFQESFHSENKLSLPPYTLHFAKVTKPSLNAAKGICSFIAFKGTERLGQNSESIRLGTCAAEFENKVKFFCRTLGANETSQGLNLYVQANFGKEKHFDLRPPRNISIVATAECHRSE